jgi:hypothetical protein
MVERSGVQPNFGTSTALPIAGTPNISEDIRLGRQPKEHFELQKSKDSMSISGCANDYFMHDITSDSGVLTKPPSLGGSLALGRIERREACYAALRAM